MQSVLNDAGTIQAYSSVLPGTTNLYDTFRDSPNQFVYSKG